MVKVEAESKGASKRWSGLVVGALIVIFIAMAMSLRISSYLSPFGRTSMPCQCSKKVACGECATVLLPGLMVAHRATGNEHGWCSNAVRSDTKPWARMFCFEKPKTGPGEVPLVAHGEACVVVPGGVVLEVGGGGLSGNGARWLVVSAEEAHGLFKSWAKLGDSELRRTGWCRATCVVAASEWLWLWRRAACIGMGG